LPQGIVNVRLGTQIALANFRIVDGVFFVADNIVEPDPAEIMITEFKSEHTKERRNPNAGADADMAPDPAPVVTSTVKTTARPMPAFS
jgi:hypothetical protein